MALNRLHTYNWEQGTSENPVSLNSDEMNNLVALALSGSVNSDVKGYVHPTSSITSYQLWVLGENYPNLHLVDATVVDADYSVLFENNLTTAAINEGNQIGIVPLNIGLEGLKFRIYSHTITTDNVATEETIRGRIHVESGRVVVNAARENSSWSDTVIIQALPIYQEWDDGVHQPKELTLNVSAIKVTSISISAPAMARPGSVVNGTIVLSYHTKPIVTSAQNDGSGIFVAPKLGDSLVVKASDGLSFSFIAPSEEDDYTITCALCAFSTTTIALTATPVTLQVMHPYIQFTVTTDGNFSDISAANPKITLQKVDSEDTPIGEPVVLTGTVSGSSLVYTHGGGLVAGDGSEIYKVNIENVRGYTTPNIADIVPNGVITEVSASYNAIQPDVFLVYSDSTLENYNTIVERGDIQSGKTPIGIRILTGGTDFVIGFNNFTLTEIDNDGTPRYAVADAECTVEPLKQVWWSWNNITDTDDDVKRQNNEYRLANYSIERDIQNNVFYKAYGKTIVLNEITYKGNIPGKSQLDAIYDNFTRISIIAQIANITLWDNTIEHIICYYFGDKNDKEYVAYKKGNNAPVSINQQRTVNGVKYVTYNDVALNVVPIFFIDF